VITVNSISMLRGVRHKPVRHFLSRILARCSYSTIDAGPKSKLQLNEEIADALATNKPLVALESTIITHGLPFPTNIEMAQKVERAVRLNGAVPATMAFLDGVPKVGLDQSDLERLAEAQDPQKVSRRDLPHVLSHKLTGGTTVAATMIMAHMAGIKVFATGGLGGVHRGVAEHWDISADLEELGRTPVAVVCSGPKSILDVPKTIEYLETKGCHVSTHSPSNTSVNVPGFFTTDSGVPSPFRFVNALDAATTVYQGTEFGLQSGYMFCVPADSQTAMDQEVVNKATEYALEEAAKQGISGKAVTPFLLKKVWEATGGDSVKTNVQFVHNNAVMAAQIAANMSAINAGIVSPFSPIYHRTVTSVAPESRNAPSQMGSIHMPVKLTPQASNKQVLGSRKYQDASVVVIGSLSQDITCTLDAEHISVSSYPGRITTSLGGTAYNVALASAYSGSSTKLVSCIGDRDEKSIAKAVSPVLDVSGVRVSSKDRTSRYVSTNDAKGELIVACADMHAIQSLKKDFIREEIDTSQPKVCVFDGNLGPDQVTEIIRATRSCSSDPLLVFEPTSVPKAARIAHQEDLGVFPNASIDIATPNYLELMSMYEEFSFREKFDIHKWFPIIDQLPLSDAASRMKLDIFSRTHPALENAIDSGLIQASIQLLPYIPNIFVTNGPNGVISFQLIENLKDRTGGVKGGANSVYILSKNRAYGILIQHFPVTAEVLDRDLKSVNGVGDTLCGALVAQLAKSRIWLRDDGPVKMEHMSKSMQAASLSLQTYQSVNSAIVTLFDESQH